AVRGIASAAGPQSVGSPPRPARTQSRSPWDRLPAAGRPARWPRNRLAPAPYAGPVLGLRPVVDPRTRLARLVLGLVLLGLGIAFMVAADLGLAPWSVLDQGI